MHGLMWNEQSHLLRPVSRPFKSQVNIRESSAWCRGKGLRVGNAPWVGRRPAPVPKPVAGRALGAEDYGSGYLLGGGWECQQENAA